jgi:flagellin-like protein
MKISRREAISPVIATIIIIAVTIAISLAVAAWLMGLWTGFVGGPRITASLINMTQTIGPPLGDVYVALMFMNTCRSSYRIQSLSAVTLRVGAYILTCKDILIGTTSQNLPISIDPTPPGTGVTLKFQFAAPKSDTTTVSLVGSTGTIEIRLTSGNTIVLTGSIVGVEQQQGG